MAKYLEIPQDKDLIDFRLKCLEIAVQMLGPKPLDPNAELDDYFNQYLSVTNAIADRIRLS
jgi:hypothetical protein